MSSLLTRYLIRQNLFLIFVILLISTGIYLLTDFFDRLDNFWEAGLGIGIVVQYFAAKIPMMISQLLPAVFLLSLVIQFNLLDRSREMMALQAGGIPVAFFVRFILLYGLVWAGGQFLFSQVLGVICDQVAHGIWQNQVQGHDEAIQIKGRWFTDKDEETGKNRIFHIGSAVPSQKRGEGLTVYVLAPSGVSLDEILEARTFTIEEERWILHDASRLRPDKYTKEHLPVLVVNVKQDLKAFLMYERSSIKPSQLPLWELSATIADLQKAGINVEALRTAWHGKLAYATSLMVMGVLALIVSQVTPNIYKAVGLSLLITFLFHSVNTLCLTMGEKQILIPIIAAWFADACFLTLSVLWLAWPRIRQRLRG